MTQQHSPASSNQARVTEGHRADGELADRTTVRVGAVDIGSNTTRLMLADVTRNTDTRELAHDILERRSTITRLAEGVDARGILLPAPIARTRNALGDYRKLARETGAVFVLATATSAVRDADNGDAFLGEIEHGYAFRAEVLTGSQEASTTWRGVTSDPATAQLAKTGSGWLIDIGGGSTEIVLTASGDVVDHHSFQLGSVRITERCIEPHDPPRSEDIEQARALIRGQFSERFPAPMTPDLALGVAGTVTTVGAVRAGMHTYDRSVLHGMMLSPEDVKQVIDALSAVDLDQRQQIAGLEPARAPVIIGGLLVLHEALLHFGISQIRISESDILDGIVLWAGEIAFREGIDELPDAFGRTVC